ncbi:hypothetical protein, partial [Anoxybacillus flavithermus]|uniref:hypothetical protein n=1 Tax=Anoxybacillus flavithermus TaxID=33934 RepID=UPI0019D6D040
MKTTKIHTIHYKQIHLLYARRLPKKFESRLCGRFFSRPIFLVIYGFIKSLYVSAFTYSHPVGMCVFS